MSDFPRTDAKAQTFQRESEVGSMGERYYLTHEVVDASFARQLERELAMMTEAHETCKRCFADAERALSATRESVLEEAAKVCEQMRPIITTDSGYTPIAQRQTLDNAARLIRALKQSEKDKP